MLKSPSAIVKKLLNSPQVATNPATPYLGLITTGRVITLPRPMKAERRHELAENELAKVIKGAPTFWQQSGGKFLLGLIVVLLIIILIQYRIRTARESLAQSMEQLSMARSYIEQLQGETAQMSWMFAPPQDVVLRRKQAISEAGNAIENALNLSDERHIQAEAMIARGDLNWTAASLPELPGAATQPSLQLKPRSEYLTTAAESYQAVINSYSDILHADMAARFGLAAIHEDRREWDAAKAVYEKILADSKDVPAYKSLAEARLNALAMLRQPPIFGAPTTEPSLAAATQMAIPPLIAAPATTQSAEAPAPGATTSPTTSATTRP